MEEQDIKTLIEQIAADDNDAFRSFYDRYYLSVYRFASYFVDSTQLIEEIVSDVFCIIWQNRKKLFHIEHFENYFYTIIKNRAFHYLRNENKITLTELETASNLLIHDETPEYITIDKELTISLQQAINELPERCRLIFRMAREEGLKYREIAGILSISEKTVNAQMVLAIKKLSKQLGNMLFFLF